jgi:hypothetical protein
MKPGQPLTRQDFISPILKKQTSAFAVTQEPMKILITHRKEVANAGLAIGSMCANIKN